MKSNAGYFTNKFPKNVKIKFKALNIIKFTSLILLFWHDLNFDVH
jgi:hypothetical protein